MRIITGKANDSVSNALGSGDCLDSASVRGRDVTKPIPNWISFLSGRYGSFELGAQGLLRDHP